MPGSRAPASSRPTAHRRVARKGPPRASSRRPIPPTVAPREGPEEYPAPRVFRPSRDSAPGRRPLLEVFRGLDETIPFRKYPGDDAKIRAIAEGTSAHVFDGPGWMYVAPQRTPPEVRAAGFRMVETRDDVIVVSQAHLANSPSMDVYLDVIHEFLHILQRHQGRELWPRPIPYVDRPTEVEAYAFSVAEARRLGVSDEYLRKYLEVTWVPVAEHRRLLRHLGVPSK